MKNVEMADYTWSEEARGDSYMKTFIQKYGEIIKAGPIINFVTGQLIQTNIPECEKDGPGKWLWTGWVQKKA